MKALAATALIAFGIWFTFGTELGETLGVLGILIAGLGCLLADDPCLPERKPGPSNTPP